MEKGNNNQEHLDQKGGMGRTYNQEPQGHEASRTEADRVDISSIDQQEGLMQNGETGGGGALSSDNSGSSTSDK